MRLPVSLLIIFLILSVASNRGQVGDFLNPETSIEDKVKLMTVIALKTPSKTYQNLTEAFALYQTEGTEVALGMALLWGCGLLFIFLFVYRMIGWIIGLVAPLASEEREGLLAFVLALGAMAVAIGAPINPRPIIVFLGLLLFAWAGLSMLKKKKPPVQAGGSSR